MRFLINLDLEGVNHVVGVPYESLGHSMASEQYRIAVEEAIIEVNTVVAALFDCGAEFVALWDTHGGGGNIDFSRIDSRCHCIPKEEAHTGGSMDFADKYHFDSLFLIGYHSMEGTLGGVLAHTMNSKEYQYIRIGGKDVGEIELNSYVASSKGIPLCFVSSDDKGCAEAYAFKPDISTVITKTGLSRNEAVCRPDADVLDDLYHTAQKAALTPHRLILLSFPAVYEIRYTRTERAAVAYERCPLPVSYRGDAHTLTAVLRDITELQKILKM